MGEFLRVCDAQPEDAQLAMDGWRANALEAGWAEIGEPPHPGHDRSFKSEWAVKTLFDGLNAGFAASYASQAPRVVGNKLFRKAVGGRTLFISLFGMDRGNETPVIECRLHDPLGDGILTVPFSKNDVERITAVQVNTAKGYFGETVYRWRESGDKGALRFMEVHFGFDGWPFGPFGRSKRKTDPYASYGMTLVTGWKSLIIVT